MADCIPEVLANAIKGHKMAFVEAFKQLTPADIKADMPLMRQSIQNADSTGVARFEVDQQETGDKSCLTAAGWAAVAMKAASKDMRNLKVLYDVGATILGRHSEGAGSSSSQAPVAVEVEDS